MRNSIAAIFLMALSGCAQTEVKPDGTAVQICRTWETIRPSRKDVLTDDTAKQIAGNNVAREQWCYPPARFAAVTSRS